MEPKEIIKAIGLPASKIALTLGVSRDAVKSWQCGRRSPQKRHMELLLKLSKRAVSVKK